MKAEKAIKREIVKMGKVVKFRDLGELAQLAMIQYMAVDGEAWPLGKHMSRVKSRFDRDRAWKRAIKLDLEEFVKNFGDEEFGYAEIPMEKCKEWIMMCDEIKGDHKDFEEYHKWYGEVERHRRVRPCILNCEEDFFTWGLFQDGWHRFHRYVEMGLDKVPVLYYV